MDPYGDEVAALAEGYRLAILSAPASQRAGDVLSRRTGGSIEFEDFRPYTPGDDPRHIDWAAYARSDQIFVRLHRAEVRLAVEVLVDRSLSMATGDGSKAERARQLALLICRLAGRAGASLRLWSVGDRMERIPDDPHHVLPGLPFDARASMPEVLQGGLDGLEVGSVRVVVSDFLFPHDPERLHAALSRTAGALGVVQILTPEEIDPPTGMAQLQDVETAQERPLWIDARAVRSYKARLGSLVDGLRQACRRTYSPFASVSSGSGLDALCRLDLVPVGLLEPV